MRKFPVTITLTIRKTRTTWSMSVRITVKKSQ